MSSKYAAYCLAMAAVANAIVGPNLPWGGVVDVAGQECKIGWSLDTTGTWKNMSIELMTGDNQAFVHLSWVTHGLDGTTGDGSYTWTCPTVDPPAPIYFYQFTNPGQAATYTTRFTLAAADGTTVPAPEQTQPDGSAIPWGTGRIVSGGDGSGSGSGSGSSNSSGSSSTNGSTGGSSAPSSPSSGVTSPSSSTSGSSTTGGETTDADTTIVTVQPGTTGTTRLPNASNTRTTSSNAPGVSSGIIGNGNNSNNTTGAAGRNVQQGSMAAGLGLIFAVTAGWVMA